VIDIEAIEKQLASDRGHLIATADVLALIAEVRALREDAERYQWLKAHWGHRTPILNGLFPKGTMDDAFDAGIDAAIAKDKP
jgi:hypothetical protein